MPRVAENLTKEQRLAGWKRLTDKQQSFLDNFMHKDMTKGSGQALTLGVMGCRAFGLVGL
jgi:hypothetical protein